MTTSSELTFYQTVAEHWPGFRERVEDAGGLPKFIVREFEEYLKCGILGHGCLHLVCRSCGYSEADVLQRRSGRRKREKLIRYADDLPMTPKCYQASRLRRQVARFSWKRRTSRLACAS